MDRVKFTSHPINYDILSMFEKCVYNFLILNLMDQCLKFEQKKLEIISG